MSNSVEVDGPDGGWGWMVALATGTTDAIITSTTFGMSPFYIEFRNHFNTTAAETSWVVSLQQTCYLLAFVGTFTADKIGARKTVMIFGCIAVIGIFVGQFSTSIYFLYVTVGFLAGFGFAGCLAPAHVTLAKYFPKRYPLVNGIVFLAPGIGLFIFPPLFQACIDMFGWRGALLILAGIVANVCVCGALLRPLSNQQPVREDGSRGMDYTSSSSVEHLERKVDDKSDNTCGISYFHGYLALFHNWKFVLFVISVLFFALAYSGMMLHLQPRASEVKVGTSQQTSFLLSIVGISSLVGRVGSGLLVHFKLISPSAIYILAVTIIGMPCFIPQLGDTYIGHAIFSGLIGFGSGLLFSACFVCCRDFVHPRQISYGFSCLFLVVGLGQILGPPLAGKIFDVTSSYGYTYFTLGALSLMSGGIMVPGHVIRWRHSYISKRPAITDEGARTQSIS